MQKVFAVFADPIRQIYSFNPAFYSQNPFQSLCQRVSASTTNTPLESPDPHFYDYPPLIAVKAASILRTLAKTLCHAVASQTAVTPHDLRPHFYMCAHIISSYRSLQNPKSISSERGPVGL
jgi:hypothetical protein